MTKNAARHQDFRCPSGEKEWATQACSYLYTAEPCYNVPGSNSFPVVTCDSFSPVWSLIATVYYFPVRWAHEIWLSRFLHCVWCAAEQISSKCEMRSQWTSVHLQAFAQWQSSNYVDWHYGNALYCGVRRARMHTFKKLPQSAAVPLYSL